MNRPTRITLLSIPFCLVLAVLHSCNARAQDPSDRFKKLDDALRESSELRAKIRKKAGFPPADDVVGTVMHCDQMIRAYKAKFLACARSGLFELGPASQEAADVLADGLIGRCGTQKRKLIADAVPYCMKQKDAEEAVGELSRKVREQLLGAIVEGRAKASMPPTPSLPKPKGTQI